MKILEKTNPSACAAVRCLAGTTGHLWELGGYSPKPGAATDKLLRLKPGEKIRGAITGTPYVEGPRREDLTTWVGGVGVAIGVAVSVLIALYQTHDSKQSAKEQQERHDELMKEHQTTQDELERLRKDVDELNKKLGKDTPPASKTDEKPQKEPVDHTVGKDTSPASETNKEPQKRPADDTGGFLGGRLADEDEFDSPLDTSPDLQIPTDDTSGFLGPSLDDFWDSVEQERHEQERMKKIMEKSRIHSTPESERAALEHGMKSLLAKKEQLEAESRRILIDREAALMDSQEHIIDISDPTWPIEPLEGQVDLKNCLVMD